ncbi:MAG TPA: hypothetical protein VMA35_14815 [Candidatus Sulfopaludibacter sp.]|nr:hypothetical protein [Candidatus Sulfopaludibacter sp.]
MKIEFNPRPVSQPESSQPQKLSGQSATPVATDSTSFASSALLKGQLNQIPLVRTEQVARGQSLVRSGNYPPDDVLDRIAALLGIHVKDSQGGQ